jgi:hypothetical protein
MSTGEEPGAAQLPGEASPSPRSCPYCGACAVHDVEEAPGEGILGATFSVCAACGQSTSRPHWTQASTRRALLLVVRALGSVILFAVAAWLLAPLFSRLPTRSSGST